MNRPSSHRVRWHLRRLRPLVRPPLVSVRHVGIREDDWIVAEHPKSGGTWLAFMLGEALFGTDMDFSNQSRFMPAVGRHRHAPVVPGVGGRLLRTHERWRPAYARGIYLVRHVADVAVSYHRWLEWLGVPGVSFDEFLPEFLKGHIDGWGPWQRHVSSWLDARSSAVHIVRYEDLRADTEGVLACALRFIGVPMDAAVLARAVENNTFERMREKEEGARSSVFGTRTEGTHFVRSGAVGEGLRLLRPDQIAMIDRFAGPQLRRLGYELLPAPGA